MEIIVTSVPSTGTTWLLQQLTPYYGQYKYLRQVLDGNYDPRMGFTHYAISNVAPTEIVRASRDHNAPIFTPLRDPLLALTTWSAGGKLGRDTLKRLQGWYHMATVELLCDVTYVPVDLPEVGKAVMKEKGYYANFEHPLNSKASKSANRAAYDAGNYSYVPAEYWAYLKDLEPTLRPILERVGYTNLGWWS